MVYVGWLPNIQLNKTYVQKQLINIRLRKPSEGHFGDNDKEEDELTDLQKHMLGILNLQLLYIKYNLYKHNDRYKNN